MSGDREAWVKALAARYEEKVFALDAAFDAGFTEAEGKAVWLALAEIAAEETERLALAHEKRVMEWAPVFAATGKYFAHTLPWREALEDKAR